MRILNAISRGLKLSCLVLYRALKNLPITFCNRIRWLEMLGRKALRKAFSRAHKLPKISIFTNRITLKPLVGVLLATIVLSVLTIGLSGLLNISTTLPGRGKVTAIGVGIYQDSACTVPVLDFNWGTLDPGSTKYIEAYVKNEGNVPVKLSLYAVNWIPSNASSYFEFGWDYDNSVINAREDNILKVPFYLRVASDVQGLNEFSFDIIIDATKA